MIYLKDQGHRGPKVSTQWRRFCRAVAQDDSFDRRQLPAGSRAGWRDSATVPGGAGGCTHRPRAGVAVAVLAGKLQPLRARRLGRVARPSPSRPTRRTAQATSVNRLRSCAPCFCRHLRCFAGRASHPVLAIGAWRSLRRNMPVCASTRPRRSCFH